MTVEYVPATVIVQRRNGSYKWVDYLTDLTSWEQGWAIRDELRAKGFEARVIWKRK